jgi:hypothetical protein
MIRPARIEDAPILARFGAEFFKEANLGAFTEYVPMDCANSLRRMIRSPQCFVLVVEVDGEVQGFAAGQVSGFYFNAKHKHGVELFFWMQPKYRGKWGLRLLTEIEHNARLKGCTTWSMVSLEAVNPEAVDKFYVKRGYTRLEHIYIKTL